MRAFLLGAMSTIAAAMLSAAITYVNTKPEEGYRLVEEKEFGNMMNSVANLQLTLVVDACRTDGMFYAYNEVYHCISDSDLRARSGKKSLR